MPTRLRGSTHFRINRKIPGVGRLQVSSQTDKKVEYDRRNGLVTKLKEMGQLETLRLLKRGTLTIADLVDADRRGTLGHLTEHVLTLRPLLPAFEQWITEHRLAPKTQRDYREHIRRLVTFAQELKQLPADPVIADLERINWARVHTEWPGTDFDWQNVRIPLSSFLSTALNRSLRPFRQRVMDLIPGVKLPEQIHTISAASFQKVLNKAPAVLRPCYVLMAICGVGPGEYAQIQVADLDAERHLVHVRGTKNRFRNRYVKVDPRLWKVVSAAVPAPLGEQMLRRRWNDACKKVGVGRVRLYDLRHLSGQAASDAGVPVQSIAKHMGHSKLSTTMGYLGGPMVAAVAKGVADTLLTAVDLPALEAELP